MSKKTENLAQRAKQLSEEEHWNELIQVATEWIGLEQEPEKQAQAYTDRGRAYYKKGDYDRAFEDFDKAIELDPSDARAYRQRGIVYAEKGDYVRAIADCDKAIALAPRYAMAYRQRGAAYALKGDYDRAFADFNKAIELDPSDARAYRQRGAAYSLKGDYDRAIADFNKAIELDLRDARAYRQRGAAYALKGDYDRACEDLDKVIELDPRDAQAYSQRGDAYALKGDYDRAFEDFNKTIELDPRDAQAYSQRGAAYALKGDYDRAFEDFNKAIELDPRDAQAYSQRGAAYALKGDYDRAFEYLDKVIELDLRDVMAYHQRGDAYAAKGDYDHAIADYDKAIELVPRDALAYRQRGDAYARKGDYRRSFDDLNEAVNLNSELPFHIPECYIAYQIGTIFKTEDETKYEVFEFYFELSQAIKALQKKLFCVPKETGVAHYTSFHTIKHPGQKGRFRLYNTAYMSDPKEGSIFFEIMKEHGVDLWQFYPDNENPSYRSPAYIGSFVQLDSSEQDKLPLWQTYGKHEGKEAAGCCLIYRKECFAESHKPQIGAMQQQWKSASLPTAQTGKNKKTEYSPDAKPYLYKIIYRDTEDHKELSEESTELAKCLNRIKDFIEGIDPKKDTKKTGGILELARALLDSIRFLFKDHYYSGEKEVRVCSIRYYTAEGTQESDEIKVDTEKEPLRFYLDTPEAFQFNKVILGPGARNIPERERSLKEKFKDKDVEVQRSQIPYRTRPL